MGIHDMTRTPNPILLAAGGTGGHVFPAEALARELMARGYEVELVTDARGQAFGGDLATVAVHRVHAASPGKGLWGKIKAGLIMGRGLIQATSMIKRVRPAAVIGFGGYPSVPAVFAAARAGVPAMLHEQNAVLGRANRMLAPGARKIAGAFPDIAGLTPAGLKKLVRTGNPVRPSVAERRDAAYRAPGADGPIDILVIGGSQGAAVFADMIPAALALLPLEMRARIRLAQQARPENLDDVRRNLAGLGLGSVTVESFFRDVPERLAACQLAITRSGASTLAELTCIGRPAVLVPYPFATDDHQTANARALAQAGAAVHLAQADATAADLAQRLTALFNEPARLAAMAAAAHAWGTAQAAVALADQVEDLLSAPQPAANPREEGRGGNGGGHPEHHDIRHLPREAAV